MFNLKDWIYDPEYADDWDDDFLMPNEYAIEKAEILLEEIDKHPELSVVRIIPSTSGNGGLRFYFELMDSTRELTISIPPNILQQKYKHGYVYYRDGEFDGVEDLSPEVLVRWLRWMINNSV